MKTIMVCLSNEKDTEELLRAALPIAQRHDSHLIGFHVQEHVSFYPGVSVHVPADIFVELQERQKGESEAVKAVFDRLTSAAGVPCEWRMMKAASPDTADVLAEVAHIADLVIMAQDDYALDRSSRYSTQESVIRGSGRPVLFVPTGCEVGNIGKKIVIGWSPTREAARATHDAISLLQQGAEVTIATVAKSAQDSYDEATDLARALDRHGFQAEVVQRSLTSSNVAEELNELAFERGADMIVTGAFGHSRLYDFVIGAVTLDLMRHSRLPVLFSN